MSHAALWVGGRDGGCRVPSRQNSLDKDWVLRAFGISASAI